MNGMSKGERTRERIGRIALDMMRTRGLEQVRVEEIAREAGVTKSSFYSYFSSKNEILIHLLQECVDAVAFEIYQADLGSDPYGRLCGLTEVYCRVVEEHLGVDLQRVLCASLMQPGRRGVDLLDRGTLLYGEMHKAVCGMQQEGSFPSSAEADVLTDQLVQVLRGVLYDWVLRNGAFSLREEALQLVRTFCQGLSARMAGRAEEGPEEA